MIDNTIFMGINAPREHQAVITQLIFELAYLYKQKLIPYFPYPETMIDASQTSPAPDIMLVDPETELSKVIIEITHTQGVKKDLQKIQELMRGYEVPEGFVYDYKQRKWYRFSLEQGEVENGNAYCATIGRSLADMLA